MSSAASSSATIKKPLVTQPEWLKPISSTDQPVLKIYNSLTRTKNEFIPITPNHINWYCCGPTVYDHSHMGHARNYVSTDICRRILQDYFGYNINFVQNVTDIDDKIIIAARQEYLFDEKLTKIYQEVNEDLIKNAKLYLSYYINKNLPSFENDDILQFKKWINSIKIDEISKTNPKFPMYIKAAKLAFETIYSSESPSTPVNEYLSNIKEVAMPYLDKEFGSTVNDPEIFKKLPSFWENKFNEDMAKLNVLPSSITTRVSEYIPNIIDFVDKIIENGYAYSTNDGSVYFDTAKFENSSSHDYAKLQPWNKGSLELINDGEGSLSNQQSTKKNLADFALWKSLKPGEPSWESKWGKGRPGWHIECSVMASDITGETMDIHSGGIDLCFPHHDNELAQSEAYFDNKQWVNYFMHNGHLHIQGQKMSKSLKNFITIEDALNDFSARQLRLVFALSYWEKPIDFKDSLISEVKSFESSISKFFTNVRALNNDYKHNLSQGKYVLKKLGESEKNLLSIFKQSQIDLHAAFCDNLSSPQALRIIQDLISKTNNYIQASSSEIRIEVLLNITKWIVNILNILGFDSRSDKLGWSDESELSQDSSSKENIVLPYVKLLSDFRDSVRNSAINKNDYNDFLKVSDSLRSDLINLGISLDDKPNGSALVKFLNPQEQKELIDQQLAKERAILEKQKKKEQQAIANAKKEQEKLAKMKINPLDLFKDETLYKEWDDQGIPTQDVNGEEVTKSMRKKLLKQYQQQEKLYQEYLKLSANK